MKRKVKKRRLKIKRIVLLIIIIFSLSMLIIQSKNIKIYYLSKTTNYKSETIEVFMENNIISNIKEKDYSQTLEEVIGTEYYNEKFLNDYLMVNYHDKDTFLKELDILLGLGYNSNDINQIYNKLNDDSIKILIDTDYIKDISSIINIEYFNEDKLARYLDYYLKEKKSVENTVTYVNIGLDNKYYTNTSKIDDQDDLLVLVNKYQELSKNFVPKDLKVISSKYQWNGRTNKLTKEAATAFEEMCAAAVKDKIYIYAASGYRSYATQKYLYNNYVAQDGFAAAETYSARPGYSEHQTGLAMDIANKYDFISKKDKEYTWLVNNSYKYGYILRYPEKKDNITGYMYEEWHYRYVGKDVAKEVYESNLTYDEYIARKIS